VADAAVPEVVALCVPSVQELDAPRKPGLADLEDQVDVVRHLDSAVDAPAVPTRSIAQEARVRVVVVGVLEKRTSVDSAGVHVVVAVRKPGSERARHLRRP